MTEMTEAEFEAGMAKAWGREPKLEAAGRSMGLPRQSAPLEAGAANAAREMATEAARELLLLAQSRGGMKADEAKAMVNEKVHAAYEAAAQTSAFDSQRFTDVAKALESASDGYKRKTPLVTESQSREIKYDGHIWTPERVTLNEADKGPAWSRRVSFM